MPSKTRLPLPLATSFHNAMGPPSGNTRKKAALRTRETSPGVTQSMSSRRKLHRASDLRDAALRLAKFTYYGIFAQKYRAACKERLITHMAKYGADTKRRVRYEPSLYEIDRRIISEVDPDGIWDAKPRSRVMQLTRHIVLKDDEVLRLGRAVTFTDDDLHKMADVVEECQVTGTHISAIELWEIAREYARATKPGLWEHALSKPNLTKAQKWTLKSTGKPMAEKPHADFMMRLKIVTGVRKRKLNTLESVRAYHACAKAVDEYFETNDAFFNDGLSLAEATGIFWNDLNDEDRNMLLAAGVDPGEVEVSHVINSDEFGLAGAKDAKMTGLCKLGLTKNRVGADGYREHVTFIPWTCVSVDQSGETRTCTLLNSVIFKGAPASKKLRDALQFSELLCERGMAVFYNAESAYVNTEIFRKQFQTAIGSLPPPNKRKWAVFVMDNHSSHVLDPEYQLELMMKHKILLRFLPPHSTNFLQPQDVCFFRQLKAALLAIISKLQEAGNHIETSRRSFVDAYVEAYAKVEHCIARSFELCGFHVDKKNCRIRWSTKLVDTSVISIGAELARLKAEGKLALADLMDDDDAKASFRQKELDRIHARFEANQRRAVEDEDNSTREVNEAVLEAAMRDADAEGDAGAAPEPRTLSPHDERRRALFEVATSSENEAAMARAADAEAAEQLRLLKITQPMLLFLQKRRDEKRVAIYKKEADRRSYAVKLMAKHGVDKNGLSARLDISGSESVLFLHKSTLMKHIVKAREKTEADKAARAVAEQKARDELAKHASLSAFAQGDRDAAQAGLSTDGITLVSQRSKLKVYRNCLIDRLKREASADASKTAYLEHPRMAPVPLSAAIDRMPLAAMVDALLVMFPAGFIPPQAPDAAPAPTAAEQPAAQVALHAVAPEAAAPPVPGDTNDAGAVFSRALDGNGVAAAPAGNAVPHIVGLGGHDGDHGLRACASRQQMVIELDFDDGDCSESGTDDESNGSDGGSNGTSSAAGSASGSQVSLSPHVAAKRPSRPSGARRSKRQRHVPRRLQD